MLPARAANAEALLCPANLAPLAHPRNVIVIHDAAALRHPEWYSPAYAAWQGRILPALARRALHVVTVSEFSRRELTELLGAPGRLRDPRRRRPPLHPRRGHDTARRELGLTKPYVLCVASQTARKNLQALDAAGPAHRGRRRRRPPPAVRARGGARARSATSAPCPSACSPASTPARRRSRSRASTRASACRCSRRWRAGRPSSPPTSPRCRKPPAEPPGSRRRRKWPSARGSCSMTRREGAAARCGPAPREEFTWARTAAEMDALLSAL